jgi:hypothetical protein
VEEEHTPVERALDPDRLLEGEDPHSRDPEDALHWLQVYDELYRFKADLVTQTRARLARMPAAARREVKETDLAILLRESERLHGRREFWRERVRLLAPAQRA